MKKIYLTAVLFAAVIAGSVVDGRVSFEAVEDDFEAVHFDRFKPSNISCKPVEDDFELVSYDGPAKPSFIERATREDVDKAGLDALEVYNPTIRTSPTRETFDVKTGFGVRKTTGIIDFDGTRITLTFRGTSNANDWLTDSLCGKNPSLTGMGMVHAGFDAAARSALSEIEARVLAYASRNNLKLDELDYRTRGHSLGGALAAYAGYLLVQSDRLGFNGFNDGRITTVSFASPRIGDRAFAADYENVFGNGNHLRFGVWGDVVPAVPLGGLQGFKHTGVYIPMSAVDQIGGALRGHVANAVANPLDLTNPLTASVGGTMIGAAPLTVPALVGSLVIGLHSAEGYAVNAGKAFEEFKAEQSSKGVQIASESLEKSPKGFGKVKAVASKVLRAFNWIKSKISA